MKVLIQLSVTVANIKLKVCKNSVIIINISGKIHMLLALTFTVQFTLDIFVRDDFGLLKMM